MNSVSIQPTTFNAYTYIQEANSSYIHNTHYTAIPDALSGPTMSLMMLLSTLQYQPSISPVYSNAANQAGKAAYIESGGQAFQDRFMGFVTKKSEKMAKTATNYVGITETQIAIALGIAKVARDRRIDVNGPRIHLINTHLTLDLQSVTLGLKYEY